MGIFGWSYPPGAANDPNAPWNQVEGPCDVCGHDVDDCLCPECPQCGTQGDPECYETHGMERTQEQIDGRAKMDAIIEDEAARLSQFEPEYEDY